MAYDNPLADRVDDSRRRKTEVPIIKLPPVQVTPPRRTSGPAQPVAAAPVAVEGAPDAAGAPAGVDAVPMQAIAAPVTTGAESIGAIEQARIRAAAPMGGGTPIDYQQPGPASLAARALPDQIPAGDAPAAPGGATGGWGQPTAGASGGWSPSAYERGAQLRTGIADAWNNPSEGQRAAGAFIAPAIDFVRGIAGSQPTSGPVTTAAASAPAAPTIAAPPPFDPAVRGQGQGIAAPPPPLASQALPPGVQDVTQRIGNMTAPATGGMTTEESNAFYGAQNRADRAKAEMDARSNFDANTNAMNANAEWARAWGENRDAQDRARFAESAYARNQLGGVKSARIAREDANVAARDLSLAGRVKPIERNTIAEVATGQDMVNKDRLTGQAIARGRVMDPLAARAAQQGLAIGDLGLQERQVRAGLVSQIQSAKTPEQLQMLADQLRAFDGHGRTDNQFDIKVAGGGVVDGQAQPQHVVVLNKRTGRYEYAAPPTASGDAAGMPEGTIRSKGSQRQVMKGGKWVEM